MRVRALVFVSLFLGLCFGQEQDRTGLLTVVPIREQHVAATADAFSKTLQASVATKGLVCKMTRMA